MLCKIAELLVEVPESEDLRSRCADYLCKENTAVDIVIHSDQYRKNKYHPRASEEMIAYMETAYQFYMELTRFSGLFLHASAVVYNGRAYLFSGHCGAGKSTHTRLWQSTFGEDARVINDDKPALRRLDGKWYAYGTPWCGKDGININEKAPLGGICFVKQAKENKIRRLNDIEALQRIMAQTARKFPDVKLLDEMLRHLELLLNEIPMYELENLPVPDAARLSYETMNHGAEELGL